MDLLFSHSQPGKTWRENFGGGGGVILGGGGGGKAPPPVTGGGGGGGVPVFCFRFPLSVTVYIYYDDARIGIS